MTTQTVVVHIRSLSYTGTTWLNLLLGCHEEAMALGPLDRLWQVLNNNWTIPWRVVHTAANGYCLVHGDECDFWPRFAQGYSREENLFVALSRASGKRILVTNNLLPTGVGTQLDDPDVTVKDVQLIRDGRELVASYLRKHPGKTFLAGITGFLQTSFASFECKNDDQHLCLRYEDLMSEPWAVLQKIGRFLGFDYGEDALRFWDRRHHLAGGNPGTIALLRLAEGLDIAEFEGSSFYQTQFERLQREGPGAFRDNRMSGTISRQDLFYFDCLAGADNARLGYERDQFTQEEKLEFGALARAEVEAGHVPEYFATQLRPYFPKTQPQDRRQTVGSRTQLRHDDQAFARYRTGVGRMDREALMSWSANIDASLEGAGLSNPFALYERIVELLARSQKFDVRPLAELMEPLAPDRVRVCLRHDIDSTLPAALKAAQLLARKGLAGSFYVLHTAAYYGEVKDGKFLRQPGFKSVLQDFSQTGCEIGLHIDPLHLYVENGIDGAEAVRVELAWLREHGMRVQGVVAHNSAPLYGAENFEVIHGLALGSRTSVTVGGVKIPLQSVGLSELGLTYEGNHPLPPRDCDQYQLAPYLAHIPPDCLRRTDWQAIYFLHNPVFERPNDLSFWLIGRDRWVVAEHHPVRRLYSNISNREALALMERVETGRRMVIVIHPEYIGGSDHIEKTQARGTT